MSKSAARDGRKSKPTEAEREFILTQMIRNEAAGRVQPLLAAKIRSGGTDDEAFGELFRRNPDWREILKAACEAEFAITRDEAREVEGAVRKELGDEFDEQGIAQYPRVRRARHTAAMWKSLGDQCDTECDQARLWRRVTRNLTTVGRVA
jgi:hypothetical protein